MRVCFCLLIVIAAALPARSQEPLHARIDQLIEARSGGPLAAVSTDVEFHRRVHLDLVGRVPSIDETKSFLADTAADRREKLIDRLLASEDHTRRLAQALNVTLMERLGDHDEWQKFLRGS